MNVVGGESGNCFACIRFSSWTERLVGAGGWDTTSLTSDPAGHVSRVTKACIAMLFLNFRFCGLDVNVNVNVKNFLAWFE